MYLGLMKRGLSFMGVFFGCIAAAVFFSNMFRQFLFGIEVATVLALPVLWFASFFDFWRFPRMNPDERAAVQDDFLLPKNLKMPKIITTRKIRIVGGVLLIFAGLQYLYVMFIRDYIWYEQLHSQLANLLRNLPSVVGAILIITAGLALIFWKAKQIKREAVNDGEE